MALIDVVASQVASLIQAFNNMNASARKTSEFPLQNPMVNTSLVRVEREGISEHISIRQIVDEATSYLSNELLYFSGVTIVGNTVTLNIGSVWRINSVVYSTTTTKVFNIPFASVGAVRIDLLVGDNTNNVTRIVGNENDIAVKPTHPNDKVIICELNITESSIEVAVSASQAVSKISYPRLLAATQIFVIPEGKKAIYAYVNGSVWHLNDPVLSAEPNTFTQSGNSVTFKTARAVGNSVIIYHQ